LVILEVAVVIPRYGSVIDTCMDRAHGAVLPIEVVHQALRAS
jgi:hypothetical protein